MLRKLNFHTVREPARSDEWIQSDTAARFGSAENVDIDRSQWLRGGVQFRDERAGIQFFFVGLWGEKGKEIGHCWFIVQLKDQVPREPYY
jgi:hypothetical protein